MQTEVYSLDSSSIINIFKNYPVEFFDIILDFETLAQTNRIIISRAVFEEITKKSDSATAWLSDKMKSYEKIADMVLVNEIIKSHPKLVDPNKSGVQADPHTIAIAIAIKNDNSQKCTVVTEEGTKSPNKFPKYVKVMVFTLQICLV